MLKIGQVNDSYNDGKGIIYAVWLKNYSPIPLQQFPLNSFAEICMYMPQRYVHE